MLDFDVGIGIDLRRDTVDIVFIDLENRDCSPLRGGSDRVMGAGEGAGAASVTIGGLEVFGGGCVTPVDLAGLRREPKSRAGANRREKGEIVHYCAGDRVLNCHARKVSVEFPHHKALTSGERTNTDTRAHPMRRRQEIVVAEGRCIAACGASVRSWRRAVRAAHR